MRLVQNSLHQEVAATLREHIFSGALLPGSFVDEVALCESLKISRTPLREALKVLTAEGLMRHEPRRGCFVSEVTEQDLDDIFPVIALLEGEGADHQVMRRPGSVEAHFLAVLVLLRGVLRLGHDRQTQKVAVVLRLPVPEAPGRDRGQGPARHIPDDLGRGAADLVAGVEFGVDVRDAIEGGRLELPDAH